MAYDWDAYEERREALLERLGDVYSYSDWISDTLFEECLSSFIHARSQLWHWSGRDDSNEFTTLFTRSIQEDLDRATLFLRASVVDLNSPEEVQYLRWLWAVSFIPINFRHRWAADKWFWKDGASEYYEDNPDELIPDLLAATKEQRNDLRRRIACLREINLDPAEMRKMRDVIDARVNEMIGELSEEWFTERGFTTNAA